MPLPLPLAGDLAATSFPAAGLTAGRPVHCLRWSGTSSSNAHGGGVRGVAWVVALLHTRSRPCHSGCGSAEQRASQTMLPAPKMRINRKGRMRGAWGWGESMAGTGGLAWRTRVKTHLWRSAWTSCDGPLNACRCALWPLIGVLRPQICAARSSRPPNDAVTAGPWQSLNLTKGFKRVPCACAPRSPGLDAGATDRPRRIVKVWAMRTCTHAVGPLAA